MSDSARKSQGIFAPATDAPNWKEMTEMIADYFTMTFDEMPKGTAQMKRYDGRSGHYFKSKRLMQTEKIYMDALAEHRPKEPASGPISLSIHFHYSTKTKKRKGTWKTSRPDVDNIAKLLIDCMTKSGFWVDDSQIVRLSLSKQYSTKAEAEIYVTYREVEDD